MMIISILEAIDSNAVEFTPRKREQLRAAYNEARDAGEDVFVFEGREYVTDYAKYLLEYLDIQLVAVH
jgi:hypothetical protein